MRPSPQAVHEHGLARPAESRFVDVLDHNVVLARLVTNNRY